MSSTQTAQITVPFLDLRAQYEAIKPEVDAAIQAVVDQCAFAGGPFVSQFEEEFAAYCETEYAIGVGSGTEALWLVLLALGVGAGDEVITVPNTFMATAEAISFTGATPKFVDVREDTALMDPELLEAAITPRTKAIIPVHLYGQTADMDAILAVANRHGIPVVEDAAQAHGARYDGTAAGSMGIAGCFSFYPGKNLGAYGEAGAVTTNDRELADRIRMLRDHGQPRKYHHDAVGWNGRMDGIQGAVLSVKLRYLDGWNDARRLNAGRYSAYLQTLDSVEMVQVPAHNESVYHLFAIRVQNRATFMDELQTRGIASGIHYPVSLHLTGAYADLGYAAGSFPVAERLAEEVLSLPMYGELTDEQVAAVCQALASAAGHHT